MIIFDSHSKQKDVCQRKVMESIGQGLREAKSESAQFLQSRNSQGEMVTEFLMSYGDLNR